MMLIVGLCPARDSLTFYIGYFAVSRKLIGCEIWAKSFV